MMFMTWASAWRPLCSYKGSPSVSPQHLSPCSGFHLLTYNTAQLILFNTMPRTNSIGDPGCIRGLWDSAFCDSLKIVSFWELRFLKETNMDWLITVLNPIRNQDTFDPVSGIHLIHPKPWDAEEILSYTNCILSNGSPCEFKQALGKLLSWLVCCDLQMKNWSSMFWTVWA
jgi:hypothetical protein